MPENCRHSPDQAATGVLDEPKRRALEQGPGIREHSPSQVQDGSPHAPGESQVQARIEVPKSADPTDVPSIAAHEPLVLPESLEHEPRACLELALLEVVDAPSLMFDQSAGDLIPKPKVVACRELEPQKPVLAAGELALLPKR